MIDSNPDIKYMQRCLDLARKAGKKTKTNPLVGAVLVYDDRVIGEGYHVAYGAEHAEIMAFESVPIQDKKYISKATLFVTLEPCNHFGKTPPCTNRIIDEGVKKVVVGCLDPNPLVSGKGIQLLKEKNIDVNFPVLENDCKTLITKFEANLMGLPYVILKWAQSKDLLFSKHHQQSWLSHPYTNILTHKWRSENDAILVGKNTVIVDNPSLDVRHYEGENPIRVILDSTLSLPEDIKMRKNIGQTIIINQMKDNTEGNTVFVKVDDPRDIEAVLKKLFQLNVFSLMVEGGAEVLNEFIKSKLWHEIRLIKSHLHLQNGIPAPFAEGVLMMKQQVGSDEILYIKNPILLKP